MLVMATEPDGREDRRYSRAPVELCSKTQIDVFFKLRWQKFAKGYRMTQQQETAINRLANHRQQSRRIRYRVNAHFQLQHQLKFRLRSFQQLYVYKNPSSTNRDESQVRYGGLTQGLMHDTDPWKAVVQRKATVHQTYLHSSNIDVTIRRRQEARIDTLDW